MKPFRIVMANDLDVGESFSLMVLVISSGNIYLPIRRHAWDKNHPTH